MRQSRVFYRLRREPIHQEIGANTISSGNVSQIDIGVFRQDACPDKAGGKASAGGPGNIMFEAVANTHDAA
jgi:hypothetical protein